MASPFFLGEPEREREPERSRDAERPPDLERERDRERDRERERDRDFDLDLDLDLLMRRSSSRLGDASLLRDRDLCLSMCKPVIKTVYKYLMNMTY